MTPRRLLAQIASIALAAAALMTLSPAANAANDPPVTGAAFTTTNTAVDGTGHCKNGNEDVNCNIYDGKQYVWMNGGPSTAYVGDGSYFFAVLSPGGQADPNDGTAKNLSDDYDAYTNRTFTVSGGTVSYSGSHDFANNKIRLAPYADTTNPGGVYILAICSLDDDYPVTPSRCKYDAFKVTAAEVVNALPLTVSKDATGTYDSGYAWQLTKDVDQTVIKQVSGDVTFHYTVTATRTATAATNVRVTGTITVFNPNDDAVSGVDVTDQLSDGTVCSVTGGTDATVVKGDNLFAYSCTLTGLPQGDLDNTAAAAWSEQFLDDGSLLAEGDTDFTFTKIAFTRNGGGADDCASVSDVFNGGTAVVLGTSCDSATYEYVQTVPVPTFGYTECDTYPNTATLTTDDSGTTASASQSVKVCGAAKTGARPMSFWKNSGGQTILTGAATTGTACTVTAWLRQWAPLQDLASGSSCAQVASYAKAVVNAGRAAAATTAARLKADTLAMALDVYFSDPALGGNRLKTKKPVGSALIDLSKVCHMTDKTTGVSACSGTYVDARPAFGSAGSLTVAQILAYVSSQSDAGGTTWYAGDAGLQSLAKDTLAAVDNQKAFRAP